MKYFDPDNGGVWQETAPMSRNTQPDFDACSTSTAASLAGDNGLYRTKSTSSKYSLRSNATDGQSSGVVRFTRTLSSRNRKRVIQKNGTVNLTKEHVSKRGQRYLQDLFTTLVDIQWRYNLMVFAMGFLLSWLIFSLIWWLICLSHGDFDHIDDENWTPCVTSINSFSSAFLFSVETQHTIGYGSRFTTEECPEAIFIMCAQSITGVMIQCFMAGIVFAKLSRPKNRSQTLMFSRYACVCLRDSRLCFMFRVGDMRKSHIIGTKVSAQIIRRKTTAEGEVIPYYHTHLDVRFDDGGDDVLLIWPATIVHEINETSPLFLKSAEDMLRERFEVVVILEGTIESTGQSIQARSSYISREILWGHRFEQVVSFRKETGEYIVDYSKFNATHEVQTPLCSSKDFTEYQQMLVEMAKPPNFVNPPIMDNFANPPIMENFANPPIMENFANPPIMNNFDMRDIHQRSNSSPEARYVEPNNKAETYDAPDAIVAPLAETEC